MKIEFKFCNTESDCKTMKKYIMLPVLMICFVFSNNEALAGRSAAHKYLSSNYASSSKTKKNKVSKKKAKTSAKFTKTSPKVAKVGKKFGRKVASVSKNKAKKKKSKALY